MANNRTQYNMGFCCAKPVAERLCSNEGGADSKPRRRSASSDGAQRPICITKRKWRAEPAITSAQLAAKRGEFWDTACSYGGRKEIWDALRAIFGLSESDPMRVAIVDSAGIILPHGSLDEIYDEWGYRYEIPQYVRSDPINIVQ